MRPLAAALVLAGLCLPGTAAAALAPLHAEQGDDPAIVDSGGREVLLRGVNVNQLGDYYRANPRFDPVLPLTEADFDGIAGVGFNSVRLLVHWSALEPTRGAFDRDYLARIRRAVGWARERGLYVILDMHQDAWGKSIATPPGETCLPGFDRSNGWDGAPAWATFTDGFPTCHLFAREIAPAVAQAWQAFWTDRAGIQTALVRTWARLAREFAADPAVAGYDLLNEPNPGFLIGANDSLALGAFSARAIAAIRAAERSVPGGFSHVAFFEPGALWSALSTDFVPPPGFTGDRNIVFSPHLYGDSIAILPVSVEQGFANAADTARTYGTTVWSGEWGWFGDPAQDRGEIERYARQEDERVWGGAWWSWKQACGDPHVVPEPGALPGEISPSLNRYACRPAQRPLGIPPAIERILSRATVRAAPGRVTRLTSDSATGAFDVRGRAGGGSCRLEVWVPRPGRPRFATTGIDGLAAERIRRGWRVTGCARGEWSLRLTDRAAPGRTCVKALGLARRSLVLRRGRIRLALRSVKAESRCAGTATISIRRRARTLRAGRAKFSLAPGARRTVTVRLRRSAPRATLVLTGTDVDGTRFRKALRLQFRRSRG